MLSIGSKWNDPPNITDSIYSHAMFVWIAPEYNDALYHLSLLSVAYLGHLVSRLFSIITLIKNQIFTRGLKILTNSFRDFTIFHLVSVKASQPLLFQPLLKIDLTRRKSHCARTHEEHLEYVDLYLAAACSSLNIAKIETIWC